MSEKKKINSRKKWEDFNIGTKVLIIIGCIIAGAGLLVLFGFIVMWLWNALMPKLFGITVISYWEAWGILILSHILFHGFHGSKQVSERSRKRKLRERMRKMGEDKLTEPST